MTHPSWHLSFKSNMPRVTLPDIWHKYVCICPDDIVLCCLKKPVAGVYYRTQWEVGLGSLKNIVVVCSICSVIQTSAPQGGAFTFELDFDINTWPSVFDDLVTTHCVCHIHGRQYILLNLNHTPSCS